MFYVGVSGHPNTVFEDVQEIQPWYRIIATNYDYASPKGKPYLMLCVMRHNSNRK